jgi:hypothetical protein
MRAASRVFPPPGAAPFHYADVSGDRRYYASFARHFTHSSARPFPPHPWHQSRPLKSRTLAAGLSPSRTSTGVSSATWQQTHPVAGPELCVLREGQGENRQKRRAVAVWWLGEGLGKALSARPF